MTTVKVLAHAGKYQITSTQSAEIKALLNHSVKGIEEFIVYLMHNGGQDYRTGRSKFVTFIGCVPSDKQGTEVASVDIGGTSYAFEQIIPKEVPAHFATLVLEGNLTVYYDMERNEVYIPYNISEIDNGDIQNIIIQELVKLVKLNFIDEIANRDSFMKSRNPELIKSRITAYMLRSKDSEINNLTQDISSRQSNIRDYKERIINEAKRMEQASIQLAGYQNHDYGVDKYIAGLEDVAKHVDVENLIVNENNVSIFVNNVYAHAYVDNQDRRYYIGNMEIRIDMNNADVRFFGDNPRRSHWTAKDPHPHVDGNNGRACLGNADATIAQLCSQKEIYPLFLVCLDFLQNANTEDTAGRKIVNWDEVDEHGIVIEESVEMFKSDRNGEKYPVTERVEVYTELGWDEEPYDGLQYWSQSEAYDYACWSERYDRYVDADIYDSEEM